MKKRAGCCTDFRKSISLLLLKVGLFNQVFELAFKTQSCSTFFFFFKINFKDAYAFLKLRISPKFEVLCFFFNSVNKKFNIETDRYWHWWNLKQNGQRMVFVNADVLVYRKGNTYVLHSRGGSRKFLKAGERIHIAILLYTQTKLDALILRNGKSVHFQTIESSHGLSVSLLDCQLYTVSLSCDTSGNL